MKKNFLFSALSLIFLWLAWIIAYYIVRNDYILPSFFTTLSAAGKLFADGVFWLAFGKTMLRTLVAFVVSAVVGVALAVAARLCKGVRAFLSPIVSVMRTVPTMAIILVLLLWTTPSVAPVIVSVLVLMPAVYSAALSSFDEVEEGYGRLMEAYGMSVRKKVFGVYLPLSAPAFLKQSGGILSLGLKITVSGEVLAATYKSLGGLMQTAKMFVEMPTLLALTLVTVVVGFALEGFFWALEKIVVRWRV